MEKKSNNYYIQFDYARPSMARNLSYARDVEKAILSKSNPHNSSRLRGFTEKKIFNIPLISSLQYKVPNVQ